MYSLETLRDLNQDELAEYIEENPLVKVTSFETARHAPDYSGMSIEDIEKLTGLKEVDTLFVDSSGFGDEHEPALTVNAFQAEVNKLVKKYRGRLYAGLTGIGQFQVYITFFRKGRR